MNLLLSDDDTTRLERILSSYLSDLRMEIANTDRLAFREGLKDDETFINSLLAKLRDE